MYMMVHTCTCKTVQVHGPQSHKRTCVCICVHMCMCRCASPWVLRGHGRTLGELIFFSFLPHAFEPGSRCYFYRDCLASEL